MILLCMKNIKRAYLKRYNCYCIQVINNEYYPTYIMFM